MSNDVLLRDFQNSAARNVFIMMRYSDTPQFRVLEHTLRIALAEYGLIARLAKDACLSDDLWENIRTYMEGSTFGIAVFEEIDQRDFNPNVSLELGFMYARRRRCLLLKDKRMPRLPTDTCGKIYRDFDTYDIEVSVRDQVITWCERDLGLKKLSPDAAKQDVERSFERVIYDSIIENDFSAWGLFDTSLNPYQHIRINTAEAADTPGTSEILELQTGGSEAIGVNKKLPILRGTIEVEYCAVGSSAKALNLYFCAIPMRSPIERLIEVGATGVSEPENATSPYRTRSFVPQHHVGDGQWHRLAFAFDFCDTPTAAYSICAIRINEGCPRPGPATLWVRRVRVTTPEAAHAVD